LEIETARLRLRSFSPEDLADLVTLANNWQVARWLSTMPHPYTEADGREWIARVQQDHATGRPRRFAIALKETGRLIGGVGLDGSTGDDSEEPALGYWLGEPYWGNGYAREAIAVVIDYGLRTLGVETIRAYTDPEQPRLAKNVVPSLRGAERRSNLDRLCTTRPRLLRFARNDSVS
jgi:[ribosomal protein S5]-alanine N-acetyltransferase